MFNFDIILNAIDHFSVKENKDLFTQAAASEHDQQKEAALMTAFEDWAGTPFSQFEKYLSLDYGKEKVTASKNSLDGEKRRSDYPAFIKMTGEEYGDGGERLKINYSFSITPFGNAIIATTDKGVCYLSFFKTAENRALAGLKDKFHKAILTHYKDAMQEKALEFLSGKQMSPDGIMLHVKGSAYEYKVWEALMQVPYADLVSYGEIARAIGEPRKAQDVGVALGDNRIAVLIPCHRVIKSTGELGQYHWGARRKAAMIGWEATRK